MLSALYYPFSRCMDVAALKQLLLVFDSITFLEPIEDDEWRAHLFRQLEHQEDPRYNRYREVEGPLRTLRHEGAIQLVPPDKLKSLNSVSTSAAAVSDLLDAEWCRVASSPAAFGMPHGRRGPGGEPTWQIFPDKLPLHFRGALFNRPEIRKHLVRSGQEGASWTVSYEAGSAAAMNLHLAAADELSLAPVTDSNMHHRLMLRKLYRAVANTPAWQNPDPSYVARSLAQQTALSLVDRLAPRVAIEGMSFEQILRFREETKSVRSEFVEDLTTRFENISLAEAKTPDELVKAKTEIENEIKKELTDYKAALASARDTLWPQFVDTLTKGLGSGGIAAVALQLLWPGTQALVSGSILAGSLTLLTAALGHRAAVKKVARSASPSIAYLSHVVNP